jgi:hypothetical protein
MTKRYGLLIALTILVIVALAACGGGREPAPAAKSAEPVEAAPTQAAQPTKVPAEAAEPTAAPEPTAAVAAEPTAAPEEESLSLDSRDTGLDQLTSYRLTWHAEWKTTDQDKTEQGTWDWAEEYTSDPKAHHLSMLQPDSDDPAKVNGFEMWQVGDTTYMKSGEDEECISYSSEGAGNDIEQGLFSPTMLGSIQDAKYVGRETVNGIPTKHYKYNSKPGLLASFGEVSGETWIADDGGYVVKDAVTWKGAGGFFGRGSDTSSGEGSWTWELSDVNKSFEIKPPDGCGGSELDLPIMADATEKSRFGDMTTYKTAGQPADVATFYKDELTAAGWKLEGEPTEMGEVVMLNYVKDALKLNVMISASEGVTQVMLNVTK